MRASKVLIFGAIVLGAACAGERDEPPPARMELAAVDSVIPIPIALERFRAEIPQPPRGLRGGAESARELVGEVVRLLETGDTLGFESVTLDRGEFAYLYYETSPLSQPPYELPPALMWFQMQQGNRTAVLRLLRELGGTPLGRAEYMCEQPPMELGANRIWTGCNVRLEAGDTVRSAPLFGALIEREGRWKVLSFANDF